MKDRRQSIQDRLANEIHKFLFDRNIPQPNALSRLLARHLVDVFVLNKDGDEGWYDLISLPGNLLLKTHHRTVCNGEICCVHNPSDHHMAGWDQRWDPRFEIMMRVCDHEVLHPDPDDLTVNHNHMPGWPAAFAHVCDGCCKLDNGTVTIP